MKASYAIWFEPKTTLTIYPVSPDVQVAPLNVGFNCVIGADLDGYGESESERLAAFERGRAAACRFNCTVEIDDPAEDGRTFWRQIKAALPTATWGYVHALQVQNDDFAVYRTERRAHEHEKNGSK